MFLTGLNEFVTLFCFMVKTVALKPLLSVQATGIWRVHKTNYCMHGLDGQGREVG